MNFKALSEISEYELKEIDISLNVLYPNSQSLLHNLYLTLLTTMYTLKEIKAIGYKNRNAFSDRYYTWLLNQKLLASRGFKKPLRLTFFQALNNNLKIKKWEKGTQISYRQLRKRKNKKGEIEKIPYAKYYTVFNIDQTEPAKA